MKQVQRLSPLQLQTIELLGLTQLELEERVKQELIDNPALEEGRDPAADPAADAESDEVLSDIDPQDYGASEVDDYGDDDDYGYSKSDRPVDPVGSYTAAGVTFAENLLQDLMMLDFPNERIKRLAVFMLGSLDDNGYLSRDENRLLADFLVDTGIDATHDDFLIALTMLQGLEPAGVAARDLAECLRLQIERKLDETGEDELWLDALDLVENPAWFAYFYQRQTDALLKATGWDTERYKQVSDIVRHLNPRPTNGYNEQGLARLGETITPDLVYDGETGSLSLTNGHLPDLRVSTEFKDLYENAASLKGESAKSQKEAMDYARKKLDAANQFIEALKQRGQTMLNVMHSIIRFQPEFFRTGDDATLRPMTQEQVAAEAGCDNSTVSRMASSKYIQTDFGILPIRDFFTEGIARKDGSEVSSRYVKQLIAAYIDAEDPASPLSDQQLCDKLTAEGLVIARRTVNKYREQMGLLPARDRKHQKS